MWTNSLVVSYLGISKPSPAVVKPLSNTDSPRWRCGRQRLGVTHHEVLNVKSEPSGIADTPYGHDRSTLNGYLHSKLAQNEFIFLFMAGFIPYTRARRHNAKRETHVTSDHQQSSKTQKSFSKTSLLAHQEANLKASTTCWGRVSQRTQNIPWRAKIIKAGLGLRFHSAQIHGGQHYFHLHLQVFLPSKPSIFWSVLLSTQKHTKSFHFT